MPDPIRQTSSMEPCPGCGSVYRRGDLCNMCGTYCPERHVPSQSTWMAHKAHRGKVWDSKAHKYKKPSEGGY